MKTSTRLIMCLMLMGPAVLLAGCAGALPSVDPSTNIAAQSFDAGAKLTIAQQQYLDVQKQVIAATANAQATKDTQSLWATGTAQALDAAIAQHAATATAQAIDADAKATAQAVSAQATQQANALIIQATQTAIAINAVASATAQTAHERAVAFDQSAAINGANQARADDSANFLSTIYKLGLIALIAVCLYYLRDIIRTKALQSRLVKTDYGYFMIVRLPSGGTGFQPMLAGAADREVPPGEDVIDQMRTIRIDQVNDIPAGDEAYWKAEKKCREHAAELLLAAIELNGQSGIELPGHRELGWSGATWFVYKKPIARYLDSKGGDSGGSAIIDERYPSLHALRLAVLKRQVPIDVVDGKGFPIPLTQT